MTVIKPQSSLQRMHEVLPLIRPAIKDDDPNSEHAVWFLLDEVNGTFNDRTGLSKSLHWLRNHLEITNVDQEYVVPIMVTRDEYRAYFSPESKETPGEGLFEFLHQRYVKTTIPGLRRGFGSYKRFETV